MRTPLAIAIAALLAVGVSPAAADDPPSALVAAYGFDEGAGTIAEDASGNGHVGVIDGASWSAGRYGRALEFDGSTANVLLGSLGTFYESGFTLEAWVKKETATRNDVAVVGTFAGSGPMLWVDHLATRYHLTLGSSLSGYLDSGVSPRAAQWQHVAATYDGTTARFYIDGTEVASRPHVGSVGGSDMWRVGAYGATTAGFFDGVIDEVRIYSRALGRSEIRADLETPVTNAQSTAPSAPPDLRIESRAASSITLRWSASTDDVAVLGYAVFVDGVQRATTSETTFTFAGLACGSSYQLGVEAFDAAGNTSDRTLVNASPVCEESGGLVAAYSFDEGTGGTLQDASGHGRHGSIVGATWSAGRHGGALSFDGASARVDLPSIGTFYNNGFTLEAWVRKGSGRGDVAVVGSWTSSGGPMIWIDHRDARYRATFGTAFGDYLDSGRSPTPGAWEHVAATFDGATARFYVDGVVVASRTASSVGSSDTWRIGAYGAGAGFFDGLIDDVRIYGRALTAAEVAADMNAPVTGGTEPGDIEAPTAPGPLSVDVRPARAQLSWGAARDNVAVTVFNVHRGSESGFAPTVANRIARTPSATYVDASLPSGTYRYKITAEDQAGNVSPPSNEIAADVPPPDTVAPTVAVTSPNGGSVAGPILLTAAAADRWGVAAVEFRVGATPIAEDLDPPYEVVWDTRQELNGPRIVTAVARDTSGNSATSAAVDVELENDGGTTSGLRAAYAFDESGGSAIADASGNGRTATLVGTRGEGRFGGAAALDGTSSRVELPALGTFSTTAFSLEAWVFKQTAARDVAVVGTWTSAQGGPMIWVDHMTSRYRLTLGNAFSGYLDSGRAPVIGRWQHVAATYDGTTARFYVDGVETAARVVTGSVGGSNTWRIGNYGVPAAGFFDGRIDNVRIYDRALSATEVADNRLSRIQVERDAPVVVSRTPAPESVRASVTNPVRVTFSEPMQATTVNASTFTLETEAGTEVAAVVEYDDATRVASLAPTAALDFGTTYRVRLHAPEVKDLSDNPLAADVVWTFTTESSPPPILVVASTENPFGTYLGEILQTEGISAFTTIDVAFLTPALVSRFAVVVLGEMHLTPAQVATLDGWVRAGGNLVAMRPDRQLAGLLGLAADGGTLSDAYIAVADVGAGAGIVHEPIQFHGTADRYSLAGATALATLYANRSTATAHPAVTTRGVGANGGQAAAFAFDLARSVVYTHQGNPAWAGRERDGIVGLRPNDMFYGAAPSDPQPDWIDTSKIAIPQADEQQRLLANLITRMVRDRLPLPRFWYLPRGERAVVALSGDDHSPVSSEGHAAANFDHFRSLSPAGCNVALWECVRATSYVYPESSLTPAQAAAYVAEGFEVALHPNFGASCPPAPTASELEAVLDMQLAQFASRYPTVPAPATSRTHCVEWPDWASEARIEFERGIRLDANYYHYPGSWLGNAPGFMTGGGFPMRFAELDGTVIDTYQQHTHMHDEAGQEYPATIDALLDNAVGPKGFYGAFGTNIHHDFGAPRPMDVEIIRSAQARGVPLISYRQLLQWMDARAASKIETLSWSSGTLTFTTTVASSATGLQTLLPTRGPGNTTLSALSCSGAPHAYTLQTIKGIRYATFAAAAGTCRASYS